MTSTDRRLERNPRQLLKAIRALLAGAMGVLDSMDREQPAESAVIDSLAGTVHESLKLATARAAILRRAASKAVANEAKADFATGRRRRFKPRKARAAK